MDSSHSGFGASQSKGQPPCPGNASVERFGSRVWYSRGFYHLDRHVVSLLPVAVSFCCRVLKRRLGDSPRPSRGFGPQLGVRDRLLLAPALPGHRYISRGEPDGNGRVERRGLPPSSEARNTTTTVGEPCGAEREDAGGMPQRAPDRYASDCQGSCLTSYGKPQPLGSDRARPSSISAYKVQHGLAPFRFSRSYPSLSHDDLSGCHDRNAGPPRFRPSLPNQYLKSIILLKGPVETCHKRQRIES